ncbi:alanine--tRNA ligase, partial [archaeon]|nr:alanine--tRNA ligase [archaeon]
MKFLRKDPDKYWKVKIFEERGYKRKKCPSCGKYFWSLDDREYCGDPPCGEYEFLGKAPTKKSFDLIQMWNAVEKFFEKEGHESIKRYPVICRWFPGLYFTVASIVDFQRSVGGKPVFEFPADPLVVPQPCLRFNDIPNIGVSGRHMSCFTMIGQHSKGYWKDECMRLDYKFMTKVLGINENKLMFLEDIWAGPSAFGSSLEYFVDGLELGTSVFTSFWGSPSNYTLMDEPVIDMGAGLERFTWISQGTPTIYDASYGPVIAKLKKHVTYDEKLFLRYSKLSGKIDADTRNLSESVKQVADQLKISQEDLDNQIRPVQALYAICDHAKALTFAITDGGLPSNVGGGYNLRVILRRALNLINENEFPFTIYDVCEQHANYLKPIYPTLVNHLDGVQEILNVEEKKYSRSLDRAKRTARTILSKTSEVPRDKMVELYESQGVTPELLKQVAKKEGKNIELPYDFYSQLTATHATEKVTKFVEIDAQPTKHLYYKQPNAKEFKANVLKNITLDGKNWVVLDETLFYGEKGGQDHDLGWLNNKKVNNVQEVGKVTIHQIESLHGKVKGKIDWQRREILRNHHSCTHIVNGACRRVLGEHVWQAGAWKGIDKAHLDITHYANLTQEQVERVESLVNKTIKENREVTQKLTPRVEAEAKHGFRLYQGGAVPAKELFIVSIKDWDVEACGGTHVQNTNQIGKAVITGTERIQDGI